MRIDRLLSKQTHLRAGLLAATAICLCGSPALSDNAGHTADDPIRDAFIKQYGDRFDTNRLSSYLNLLFRAVDYDRAGLDATEIALYRKIQAALARAQDVGPPERASG